MKELLTPRERFGLLVIDEPQDRVPVFPLVTAHAARVARIPIRDYYTDGIAMARSQLAAQEFYGTSNVRGSPVTCLHFDMKIPKQVGQLPRLTSLTKPIDLAH